MKQEEMRGNRSLAEEVTEILRNRILHGEYAMGEKLTENIIAAELKVSRTPIRDAFRQLEKEQLIEYIPNKGCFARGFSKEDMKDIYAVRAAVEELAIRRVISCADARAIRQLEEQLERMRVYTQQNNYEKLLQANEEFHLMIYRMTESRFIVQTMKTYQEYVHLARKEALKKEQYLTEIYEEHEALFQAIAARDEAAAIEAARTHLKNSSQRAMDRWVGDKSF
ncbi:MAG: GntR family transcriptional regulator [Firmicutes bacterium]|nr:GntR family transcriptional regulator [Bacillota bacterium]